MHSRSIAFLTLLLAASAAHAQAFPSRPVRILVGFTAGSSIDVVVRIIGQKLSEIWSQPVIIDNRLGAGGNVAADAVAKAAPDGHMLLSPNAGLAISAAFYRKLPYDALKDLRPITQIAAQPHILAVNNDLPAKSVKELIALAKAKPGQLSFASGGPGNSDHMAGELFKYMAAIDIVHVPYKGGNQALNDTISGQVAMYFPGVPVALPMINAGKVRAFATTGAKRLPALPDVPTLAEAGVPGYEVILWYGLLGPAGLPTDVTNKIQADVARVLKMPDVRERLAGLGVEPVGSSPEAFAALLKSEIAKWEKVKKATGLTVD
jgi:tripartite-type tricarboxylate transporter receptor subunit TctC